jgi:hypothetical protein
MATPRIPSMSMIRRMTRGHEVPGWWRRLRGWWPLQDGYGLTARDASGYGNNGTLTNIDKAAGHVASRVGRALYFDADGEYVLCSTALIPTGGKTYTIWQRADTANMTEQVPWHFDSGNSRPYFALNVGGEAHASWGGSNYQYFTNQSEIDGDWHHLALWIPGTAQTDVTGCRFWVDGKESAKGSGLDSGAHDGFDRLELGSNSTFYPFRGWLSNAMVFDGELPVSAIRYLVANPWVRPLRRPVFPVAVAAGGVNRIIGGGVLV